MRALTPTNIGRYDNFESFNFKDSLNNFGIILQTYFVPPSSGLYKFILVSDDNAKLYISSNDQESEKYEIINSPTPVGKTDYRFVQVSLLMQRIFFKSKWEIWRIKY